MEKELTPQKKTKLKPREKVFAKKYVANDFNGSKTAKEVYGIEHDGYARAKASELLTKPNVIEAVEIATETLKSALEKQGVTPAKIALKVDQLLEDEDPNAIDKGLKHAMNIYGVEDLSDKKPTNTTYNQIFNIEVQKDIRDIEEKIKFRLLNPTYETDSKTQA